VDNPIWYMVDVRFAAPLPKIVTLERIKQNPLLADMPLVKRSRLSIQPVTVEEWATILTMAGMGGQ
jgi:predicted RNA-binding protein with PUA-like domain